MKKFLLVFSILFSILIVTGCGKKAEVDLNNPKIVSEPGVVKKINIINLKSNSRTYAFMINNLNEARPYQSGLQDAYVVYEMIVEGGITRLMAVFKDKNTSRIGPIRSSRHYYLDYALENDAIYVHDGWSPQAKTDISKLGINNIIPDKEGIFWRETELPVAWEHKEFTSMANVKKAAKDKKYSLTSDKGPLLNYSEEDISLDSVDGVVDANSVDIKYSNYVTTNYIYNKKEKVYYRSVNDKPHTDYVTKKQNTAKNIIIAYVNNSLIPNDKKGRQTLDNIGTGNGYFVTNGHAVPITWSKTARAEQTVYKYKNGKEIAVNDGNTYIQIAPINSATIK